MSKFSGWGAKVLYCCYFLLLLSPQSLMVKRRNSHAFCLLYLDFPAKHVHMELCDWLNFLRVTYSGHFSYLSARRSQLKTFTLDETIVEVSISSHPNYPGGQYSLPYLLWCLIVQSTTCPTENPSPPNGTSLPPLGIIWLGDHLTAQQPWAPISLAHPMWVNVGTAQTLARDQWVRVQAVGCFPCRCSICVNTVK